jgi:cathepsin B
LAIATVVLSKNLGSKNDTPFITPEFTLHHQAHTYETYSYEEHPFKNWTISQVKKLLGLKLMNTTHKNESFPTGLASVPLPENFSALQAWPDCVHEIRNQGHCGSCWAHGASEVLSDRFCIASNKSVNVVLSPQEMVSCDWFDHGCNGGILTLSWLYLRLFGIATEGCQPYVSGNGTVPVCDFFKSECKDKTKYKKYKASTFYYFYSKNAIKESIMKKGPVETGFNVYDDFLNYKSGIYKRQSDTLLGGHAVKVIGWGKENGQEYWIVANSWGKSWGENGYFRIAFDQCNFEWGMIAGDPKL